MNVGVDIVDVERFRALLVRSPRFADRFFTPDELSYCERAADPAVRLAGTFAAKEAVMKAVGLTPAVAWTRRIEIVRESSGTPHAIVRDRSIAVSISHDGAFAAAIAAA